MALAFATHGALGLVLAAKARQPIHVAEVGPIDPRTIDLEPVEVDPPADREPAHAPPSAPAPRAKQIAAPVLAARTIEAHEETSEASADTGGSTNSEVANGSEGAASPQTTAASSHAPVATRGPILLGRDGCRHYFPHDARSEEGSVTVAIDVSSTGTPAGTRVVQETPARNGFGEAAARCAASLHFAPALDESGIPVRAVATLELHFTRSRRRETLSLSLIGDARP